MEGGKLSALETGDPGFTFTCHLLAKDMEMCHQNLFKE